MGRLYHRREIMTFDKKAGKVALFPEPNVITKAHWITVKCKFCGSDRIFLYGYTKKRVQRYLCLNCKRTFIDNRAPGRMRFSAEVIASALNHFYESSSLAEAQRQIQLSYGVKPDRMTIYRWIVRYSQKAAKALNSVPIKTGSKWVADETMIKLKEKGGSRQWFWDVIDDKTRFLLASHLSESRGTRDAQILMEKAAKRANKIPRAVITDKLAAYLDGIELTFGAETKHITAKRLTAEPGTQLIERFHGTLKDRTKVMRSFLRRSTAKIVTDGWLCHYNFFRPHSALGGKTPAETAGANTSFKSWTDIVKEDKQIG